MARPFVVNDRFNPFAGTEDPLHITSEANSVPENTPYYVQLSEVPGSVVSISSLLPTTAGVAPTSGYYQVDYTYKTGLVKFNSANAGEDLDIDYWALGTPMRQRYFSAFQQRDIDVVSAGVWRYENMSDHFTYVGVPFNAFHANTWNAIDYHSHARPLRPNIWSDHTPMWCFVEQIDAITETLMANNLYVGDRNWMWWHKAASFGATVGYNAFMLKGGEHVLVMNQGNTLGWRQAFATSRLRYHHNDPVTVSARFRLSHVYKRSDTDRNFLVGIGSWNGTGGLATWMVSPVDGADVYASAAWVPGSTNGTVAFKVNDTVVVDNIAVNTITEMHVYTFVYTPGYCTLYVDETVVGTTATWITTGNVPFALFNEYSGSDNITNNALLVDYVSMTICETLPYPLKDY
jgi:hypothetical protein